MSKLQPSANPAMLQCALSCHITPDHATLACQAEEGECLVATSPTSPEPAEPAAKFPRASDCVKKVLEACTLTSRFLDVARKSLNKELLRVTTLCSGTDAAIQTLEERCMMVVLMVVSVPSAVMSSILNFPKMQPTFYWSGSRSTSQFWHILTVSRSQSRYAMQVVGDVFSVVFFGSAERYL